jgi:hypothetical protein
MPRVNEKTELAIEVDFNECSEEARADMLNRLARLYDQPGAKLKMTFEYGDPSDMFDAADEIDQQLAYRDADIKVKYSWKGKDLGTTEARGAMITPMERAGISIERRPALAREG